MDVSVRFLDCFSQLSGRSVNHIVSSLRSGRYRVAYFTLGRYRYVSRDGACLLQQLLLRETVATIQCRYKDIIAP